MSANVKSLPNLTSIHEKDFIKGIKRSPSFVDVSFANPEQQTLEFEKGLNTGAFNENSSFSKKDNVVMVGEWILGKTIGEGSSGKVKLATHYQSKETCVVKAVRRPSLQSNTDQNEKAIARIHKRELLMIREAALGLVLDHPNIVHLSSTVLGPGHFYCFFEYVSGLDLVDYIGQCTRLKENEARHIFRQLLSAVEYAHRNHVVHRDLKLENIRYDPQTGIAKVLDFGFANFYTDSTLLSTNCGSPCYASPEIYANQPYKGPEVDVWSLGVCLYGMTIGSLPFDGPNFKSLSKAVRSGKLSFPVFVSDSLKNLVTKMLHPKVSNRATISYISQHPWVMEGYETAPLDYLEYPNTRKKEAMIGEHYVKDLLSMRVREAGSALMDVLECFGARKSMEPPIGFKSRALPDDEATIIDEKDDQLSELREFKNRPKRHERMMTAGAKIKEWWQRLFSMRSRKTRHYLPTEPIEPIEPIESSMNKDLQKDILFQKKNYKNWKLVLRGMHERFATSV